jgi:CRP/FNR family transcriptional regulator
MTDDNYQRASEQQGRAPASEITLRSGEFLFREGDPKTAIYRIESGAICAYDPPEEGGRTPELELVFTGDWLGLGYLDKHTRRARAVVATRLSCFPLSSADALIAGSARAKERLHQSIEREFEFARREAMEHRERASPVEQVAAFLLGIASVNKSEGRDPSIIVDAMPCGVIADLLAMSIDTLASALVELEKQGLLERWDTTGLRLKNIAALETIADGPGLRGAADSRMSPLHSISVDYRSVA